MFTSIYYPHWQHETVVNARQPFSRNIISMTKEGESAIKSRMTTVAACQSAMAGCMTVILIKPTNTAITLASSLKSLKGILLDRANSSSGVDNGWLLPQTAAFACQSLTTVPRIRRPTATPFGFLPMDGIHAGVYFGETEWRRRVSIVCSIWGFLFVAYGNLSLMPTISTAEARIHGFSTRVPLVLKLGTSRSFNLALL
jgi:hypothetical protein